MVDSRDLRNERMSVRRDMVEIIYALTAAIGPAKYDKQVAGMTAKQMQQFVRAAIQENVTRDGVEQRAILIVATMEVMRSAIAAIDAGLAGEDADSIVEAIQYREILQRASALLKAFVKDMAQALAAQGVPVVDFANRADRLVSKYAGHDPIAGLAIVGGACLLQCEEDVRELDVQIAASEVTRSADQSSRLSVGTKAAAASDHQMLKPHDEVDGSQHHHPADNVSSVANRGRDSWRARFLVRSIVALLLVAAGAAALVMARSGGNSGSGGTSDEFPPGVTSIAPPHTNSPQPDASPPEPVTTSQGPTVGVPEKQEVARIFSSGTMVLPPSIVRPPKGLIQYVLECEANEGERVSECLAEHSIPAAEVERLFVVAQLFVNDDETPDYFIRPAKEPYCGVFYGAHLFRYWFVTGSRVNDEIAFAMAYKDGTDEVYVLESVSNGFHDLQILNLMRGAMYYDTLQFDGHQYGVTQETRVEYGQD